MSKKRGRHWPGRTIEDFRKRAKRGRRSPRRVSPELDTLEKRLNPGAILGVDVFVAAVDADKPEGDQGVTPFLFIVTRSGDPSGATTVHYAVDGGGTINPADAEADANDFPGGVFPAGQVVFDPGDTSPKTITIPVVGDTVVEPDEDFKVTLFSPDPAAVNLVKASAAGRITNDDSTNVGVTAADATRSEGDKGVTPFTFTVTRSGDSSGTTWVSYQVVGSGDHPADGRDFAGGSMPGGVVVFTPGVATLTIVVSVAGDTFQEFTEGFTVNLNASIPVVGRGFTLGPASASGAILDDDAVSLAIAADAATRREGNKSVTPFTFSVTRSGDSSGATAVNYEVKGSGASPADALDFGGVFPSG